MKKTYYTFAFVLRRILFSIVLVNTMSTICSAQKIRETELFVEAFSPPQIDWQLAGNEDRKVSISNGVYHFEHIGNNKALISARELPVLLPKEYSLHASIRLIHGTGAGYGLIFGYLDIKNFHTFNISANGYMRYGYYKDGKYFEPVPWNKYEGIDHSNYNTLSVEITATRLNFSINGKIVNSATNSDLYGEKAGFIIYGKQKMDIEKLWATHLTEEEEKVQTTQIISNRLDQPQASYKDYENKYALVIGNSDYKTMPLKNPVNDANAIAQELEGLGFQVIKVLNADKTGFKTAIREFNSILKDNPGVGLFYYAGHGLQLNGINYLVPVNADIQEEYEIEDECVPADLVLKMLSYNENPMNIIILDACRNNPFSSSFRSMGRGLAQPQAAPTGSIVAFATAPGKTASDGDNENGLYTQELIKAMGVPGLTIEQVFKQVRINVDRISEGKQIPWENSSLMGDFYFKSN